MPGTWGGYRWGGAAWDGDAAPAPDDVAPARVGDPLALVQAARRRRIAAVRPRRPTYFASAAEVVGVDDARSTLHVVAASAVRAAVDAT